MRWSKHAARKAEGTQPVQERTRTKYTPKYLTVLTKKQRMQAKFRRIKVLPWYVAAVFSVLLLLLACLCSSFVPKAYLYEDGSREESGIVMDFVGDVMLGRNIQTLGDTSGHEKIFSNMTGFWSHADLVFANLESAVLKEDVSAYEEASKSLHLWTDYSWLASAAAAGINVFACANNHSFDYGERAVLELTDYFQREEIIYSGIGQTLNDAASYEIIECGGLKIAFLSITEVYYPYAAATESQGGVLTVGYSDYNMLIYQAAQEADITVVYIHWGEENQPTVNESQVALGHQLIDAGADIVIGSHPHVVQEAELYKDGIIFYSLGNFIFDQGNTYARDSVMVEYTADQNGSGMFRLYPVRINDGVPSITTNRFYMARINRELSQGLPQDRYDLDENGFLVIPFHISFYD